MRGPIGITLAAAALAAFGWLAWVSAGTIYIEPRASLQTSISRLTTDIQEFDRGVEDHVRVAEALRRYVDRTLGGDLETVDHQLRSRLNRIGEEIGIGGLTVGTGRARNLQSPAKGEFSRRSRRALREEIDFVEVQGWISGQGTLEQVLRLVHRIEAEPWLKRIHQVRLQPKDNGGRFAASLRLVTLYLPGRAPAGSPQGVAEGQYDPAAFGRYAALVGRNPFRVPPPAAPEPQRIAPAAEPTFPYGQWTLTGVASGPNGVEVWLLNTDSGESRRLAVGETLQELVLTAASGEVAEFRLSDEQFTVAVGQRLAARNRLRK